MAMVRGYYIHNESWYAATAGGLSEGITDEVMIGLYDPDGGNDGEFAVEWHQIDDTENVARLCVFGDAWRILPQFQDMLDAMVTLPRDVRPETFYAKLRELGMTDLTRRKRWPA